MMWLQFTGFCIMWLICLTWGNSNEPKIFCYYQDTLISKDDHSKLGISDIDPTLCTYLIHLTLAGEAHSTEYSSSQITKRIEDNYKELNALRKRNEKLKTLLAIGGREMSEAMKDPSNRSNFIQNLVNLVFAHGFDGISIYDASLIGLSFPSDYNLHLDEIHAKFHEQDRDIILSITLKAGDASAKWNQNIPHISRYVDFILLIMPIHQLNSATITRTMSPLYPSSSDLSSSEVALSTNATIGFWLNAGASAEKLILGAVFDGVRYTLKNPAEHIPGSPVISSPQLSNNALIDPYNEICKLISQDNWTNVWEAEERMPYSYAGNQWRSYENIRSLIEKAEYAKAKGLGGVMAHVLNSDDHGGHCGVQFPLLRAMNCGLYKKNCTFGTADKGTFGSMLPSTEVKLVCYYDSKAANRVGYARLEPSEIDPKNCTHLIYAGLTLNKDNEAAFLRWVDSPYNGGRAGFEKFNALRKRNEKLKTLLSTRAWHQNSASYSRIYANETLRSEYVKGVALIMRGFKFDGFFIDWIYPNEHGSSPVDVQNFVLLLKEFRTSFNENNSILGITVRGSEKHAGSFYDIPQIAKYVDFITLVGEYHLSEDLSTVAWTTQYPTTRETSGLDWSVNYHSAIKYWLKQGAPAEKIVLGVQFMGLSYAVTNATKNLRGFPANIPAAINEDFTIIGYNEICKLTSQDVWATGWNVVKHVPFSYSENRWISYENDRSLFEKGKYAKAMGLGGVMAWTIDQDDHRGECGKRYPLLSALNCGLREINCIVSSTLQTTTQFGIPDQADKDAKKTCASLNVKYVRHPQNCARFWICQKINEQEFRAEPFTCGAGLNFDTSKAACKSKDLVQCN